MTAGLCRREREADLELKIKLLRQERGWARSQGRKYQRVTRNLVSVSCVASSAVASGGWWTTCTGITRTSSRGSVTSVTLAPPSPRLCTDTSNRFTTLSPASVQSVESASLELSQWCSTSVRWKANLSRYQSWRVMQNNLHLYDNLFSTNLTAVPALARLVLVKISLLQS